MNVVRTSISIIILLAISVKCLFAQQAAIDFARMNKSYENIKGCKMNVKYTLYKSWTSNEILQTLNGEVKWKSASKTYYRIGTSETFRFNDYMMQVDNENKRILLFYVIDDNMGKAQMVPSAGGIDTLLKTCIKTEFTKETQNQSSYILTFNKKHEYSKVKIVFNSKSYIINQLIFFYNTPVQVAEGAETVDYVTRLQIDYQSISTKTKISDNELDYSKYIIYSKGKLELKKEFSDYTFIDQYSPHKKQSVNIK